MPSGRQPRVKVKRLAHGEGLPLPAYQTPGSAGADLLAATPEDAPVIVRPGKVALVPTGLILEIPRGLEAQVRPRSGLAARHAVTVLNSPGTIDSDYRGEIAVILVNHGEQPFTIRRGERIAQLVVAEVRQAKLVEAKTLSGTRRGAGGFGSTGTASQEKSKKTAPPAGTTKSPTRGSRRGKKAPA